MELVDFLLARIAEDEAVLTRTETFAHSTHGYDAAGSFSATCPTCRQGILGAKTRALAECDSKRRIVHGLSGLTDARLDNDLAWAKERGDRSEQVAIETLFLLALPYSFHPDYRDEWRP